MLEYDKQYHWRIQGGRQGRAPPPWGTKFFHFHAVFGKNLKNNSNFESWRTPLGKILDPPLNINHYAENPGDSYAHVDPACFKVSLVPNWVNKFEISEIKAQVTLLATRKHSCSMRTACLPGS